MDIAVDTIDPTWVQRLIERVVAQGWCTRINCGTCASQEFRLALGLIDLDAGGAPIFRSFEAEAASLVVAGLRNCAPAGGDSRFDDVARWIINQVWRSQGDGPLAFLNGSWAGSILDGMRAHARSRDEARQRHIARQGVRKRDWKE